MKEIKNRGKEKSIEDILTENNSHKKQKFKFLEIIKK